MELMTRGSFVQAAAAASSSAYNETEATGYEGCVTTVKVSEGARQGEHAALWAARPASLVIEARHAATCATTTRAARAR